jgi:uncharacterized membrane protein YkvA (DUF1232 family)
MSSKKISPANADKHISMWSGLMDQIRLIGYLLADSKVSLLIKAIIPASLLYVISPIDFIPDVILGLGQLDDLGVVMLGAAMFIKMCPPELVQYYKDQLKLESGGAASPEITPPIDDDDSIDTTYRVLDE